MGPSSDVPADPEEHAQLAATPASKEIRKVNEVKEVGWVGCRIKSCEEFGLLQGLGLKSTAWKTKYSTVCA